MARRSSSSAATLAVLDGALPAEQLCHYREYLAKLPGHPERGLTPGVKFSSGRLGHVWAYANGVAMANPDKAAAYKSGKTGLLGFFVGQVMKATQGKANPQLVNELLQKMLK